MGIGRRDLLALGGGAVAGGLLSPVPWKVLDDSAIWTQNWKWIARPPAGPVTTRYTTCTLCGAGCGIKARCTSKGVCGIAPVRRHPVSGGALCPAVFGAHQLPYHSRRLRSAWHEGKPVGPREALAALAKAIAAAYGKVALVDERPGRALSQLYGELMYAVDGRVASVTQPEDATLDAIERLTGSATGTCGFDFEQAGVILSLGAPVLDGWGTPGRLPRLWSGRAEGAGPVFVHAGQRLSRSALLSDRHYLVRPGSETALAAGLAGVLARAGLAREPKSRLAESAAGISAEQAAMLTGIPVAEIERLARLLVERGPAIVVGGGEAASGGLGRAAEMNIAGLNALLGSIGKAGGVVARRRAPGAFAAPMKLEAIPDGSLAVLIHDASTPGVVVHETLLRRKLSPGGTLVRLTPVAPDLDGAPEIAIPATTFLESLDDAAGPRDATAASWSIAPALLEPSGGAMAPAAWAKELAGVLGVKVSEPEELMKRKSAAIFAARRGKMFNPEDGSESRLASVANEETLWKRFSQGWTWVDEPGGAQVARASLDEAVAVEARAAHEEKITSIPVAWKASAACPLASKVEAESRLRPVAGEARMNPRTAEQFGLAAGEAVIIDSDARQIEARVRTEGIVPVGVVELAATGPQAAVVLELAGRAVRVRKADL